MRAIVMQRVGGPEVLELEDVPAPEPKAGEALVEIHAVGVNFADTEWRRARYRPTPLPWILGSEGAGVVVATGAGVDPWWRGRRVALYAPRVELSGTYADRVTGPAAALVPLPDAMDFATGAAILAQGLTAFLMVHRATSCSTRSAGRPRPRAWRCWRRSGSWSTTATPAVSRSP